MEYKNVLIVTGGNVDKEILLRSMRENPQSYVIGVDKGLEILDECNITPDIVIGDFDSANTDIGDKYKAFPRAIILNPEKDYTDSHMALLKAFELNPKHIRIIGATGTRMDHTMANISLLKLCLSQGIEADILDRHNKIRMIEQHLTIKREDMYGKYISLIPFTDRVDGICLRGFKYELTDASMIKEETIGISNELREEEGHITIQKGTMIVMETKD